MYEGKTKDCAGSWTFQHKSWQVYKYRSSVSSPLDINRLKPAGVIMDTVFLFLVSVCFSFFFVTIGTSRRIAIHKTCERDSYTSSIYLDVTRKTPHRKILVKLRISNHKLNIEIGRYDKISRCDRICPVCGLNTFCLIAQNIYQLENTFSIKWVIESLITSTYQFQH